MAYRIDQAGPSEWATVRDLRLRMLWESPEAYGSAYDAEAGFTEAQWRERVAGAATYLARDDADALVGTATGWAVSSVDVMLVAMYVVPAARGTGCAHALIDAVATGAAERGAHRVLLHVTEGNVAAERCYRRYGFASTGRTELRTYPSPLIEHEYAVAVHPLSRGRG